MARRDRQKNNTGFRDTFDISSDFELEPTTKPKRISQPSVTHTSPKLNLTAVEDRRTFHPLKKNRPAATLDGKQHTLKIHHETRGPKQVIRPRVHSSNRLSNTVGFNAPKSVLICIRRKQRKEVLFAKRLTTKGAGAKRHRRNEYSNIRC